MQIQYVPSTIGCARCYAIVKLNRINVIYVLAKFDWDEMKMLYEIIKRTLRVPVLSNMSGNSEGVTRQLDVALMNVGFKLSEDLFRHLSAQHPSVVETTGYEVLAAVKELVGEHVRHNVYFIDFPQNIPDTTDFWVKEILRLLFTGETRYGQYQHSYEDMLAHHSEFIASGKERITILHLGKTLSEETVDLYHQHAMSTIPLNDADSELVKDLAEQCLHDAQPERIPMRETKALINAVRIRERQSIQIDTITDVLRLACALSDGDISLQETTKFRSFSRSLRRTLLDELNTVILHAPMQLADAHQYGERWKRLGERLHPHEYPELLCAQDVFAAARGKREFPTHAATIEAAFHHQDMTAAMNLLSMKPGVLVRNIDRVLRRSSEQDRTLLLETTQQVIGKVSGRVLLSLRDHLQNRTTKGTNRIFTNRNGRAWVTPDALMPFDESTVRMFTDLLDQEILRRLPHTQHLVVDPEVAGVAIPLSGKNKGNGFAILPRGSSMPVEAEVLRFFVYWKQKSERTDYDLSAIILDEHYEYVEHLSYTNLRAVGGVHSGDLTSAPNGATEFIDIDLSKVSGKYIIPTVNIYAGETFTEVEDCFFGMMARTYEQKGKPFEAATVRMKSDIRGNGRVSLPLAFMREDTGAWSAKWLHLYLKGQPKFNRVEINRLSTGVLTQAIIEHKYLNLDYLVDLMKQKSDVFSWQSKEDTVTGPTTFIGLQAPDKKPEGATIYTLQNLQELIPS